MFLLDVIGVGGNLVLPYIAHKVMYGRNPVYTRAMDWYMPKVGSLIGWTQYQNTKKSTQTQIGYNEYLKQGNQRALADWQKHVGSQHRSIRYPELSYSGAIYKADTGSARAMYDSDTAAANYYGNLPYRGAGLYGIGSRVSRWL